MDDQVILQIAFNAITLFAAVAVNKNDIAWIKHALEKLEKKVESNAS